MIGRVTLCLGETISIIKDVERQNCVEDGNSSLALCQWRKCKLFNNQVSLNNCQIENSTVSLSQGASNFTYNRQLTSKKWPVTRENIGRHTYSVVLKFFVERTDFTKSLMSTKKQLNVIVNNKQRNWILSFLYLFQMQNSVL